jgi:hypothetical protein
MTIVFLFPLVLSVVALAYFISSESGPIVKGVIGVLVIAAACLQFVPSLRETVHFLIPLFMQLIVCGWYYLEMQFDRNGP